MTAKKASFFFRQIPVEAGRQFLDLGTADVLEEQLKFLISSVDELNQVIPPSSSS